MSEKVPIINHSEITGEAPADRFRVDPAEYPIFRQQTELDEHWGNNQAHRLNIDQTLNTYITDTAELIATLDGTSTEYTENHEAVPPDFVIYLDKSARPVSWLVNAMWDTFSDEKRPEHSYLSIDRLTWFRESGVPVDQNGYFINASGKYRRAKARDFDISKVPEDTFAKIRSLFLPNGIENEDPDTIMSTPSILDGKNILIIDEVGNSGATLDIAKQLVSAAFPEANSVRGDYFWKPGYKVNPKNAEESQMLSAPVWYDNNISTGRGIGELSPAFFKQRYEKYPNAKTRAQNYGSMVLASYVDLATEKDQSSRELMREIIKMRDDLGAGRILISPPDNYANDRVDALMEAQGIRLAPSSDPSPDTYINIKNAINARPA